jgi:hypothetical protein
MIVLRTSRAVLIFAMVMLTASTQIAFWTIRHIKEKNDKKPSGGYQKDANPLQPKLKNTIKQINTPRPVDLTDSRACCVWVVISASNKKYDH